MLAKQLFYYNSFTAASFRTEYKTIAATPTILCVQQIFNRVRFPACVKRYSRAWESSWEFLFFMSECTVRPLGELLRIQPFTQFIG